VQLSVIETEPTDRWLRQVDWGLVAVFLVTVVHSVIFKFQETSSEIGSKRTVSNEANCVDLR
jgi:hypothetical protein